jgi:hypothetical protein
MDLTTTVGDAAGAQRRGYLKRALPIAARLALALASAAAHAQTKPSVACISPQKAGEGAGGGAVGMAAQKAGEGEGGGAVGLAAQKAGEGEGGGAVGMAAQKAGEDSGAVGALAQKPATAPPCKS